MIPAQRNGQVESNLAADQKVAMGIDPAQFGKIMTILTDLYSNRVLAFIREYSTNAWDAQVERGVKRPIEVTLPTRFNPHFVVRDFGVGLSVQDIHVIYSQYGASTKHQTNDQVGMLGLGCKSALTYTSQFTVTSVQDGTKVQVIVARDTDGSGSMHIADTSTTTDPEGTKIEIPVMAGDIDRVQREAQQFFQYWPKGSVLLDGNEPTPIYDGAMKITDDIFVLNHDDNQTHEHVVVMGNVPYPVRPPIDIPRGHSVVAVVPIGSVMPHPSRERLIEDPQTTDKTLAKLVDDYQRGIVGVVEREVRNAPTHRDALAKRFEWSAFIARGAVVTYKGEAIPMKLEHPRIARDATPYPYAPPGTTGPDRPYEILAGGYVTKTSGQWSINADAWDRFLWIQGWDYAKLSRTQAEKIRVYTDKHNLGAPNGYGGRRAATPILHPTKWPHTKWLDPKMVVDWATIDAIKLPKLTTNSYGGPARKSGSFDCWIGIDWKSEIDANDIDDSKPLYYYAGPRAYGYTRRYALMLGSVSKDFTIVTMPLNRKDKFRRDFTKAVHVHDAAQTAFTAWKAKLTKDQRLGLSIEYAGIKRMLTCLDASRVDDPVLKQAIRLASKDLTKTVEACNVFANVLGRDVILRDYTGFKNPLDKYPLFPRHVASHTDHTYWYLNAAYAANI